MNWEEIRKKQNNVKSLKGIETNDFFLAECKGSRQNNVKSLKGIETEHNCEVWSRRNYMAEQCKIPERDWNKTFAPISEAGIKQQNNVKSLKGIETPEKPVYSLCLGAQQNNVKSLKGIETIKPFPQDPSLKGAEQCKIPERDWNIWFAENPENNKI